MIFKISKLSSIVLASVNEKHVRSLAEMNSICLIPGDRISIQRGHRYEGYLALKICTNLAAEQAGTIFVDSFGEGFMDSSLLN